MTATDGIQVIGDADTVLCFSLGGIAGVAVSGADEARTALDSAAGVVRSGGGAVRCPMLLLVTRDVAALIRPDLDRVVLDPAGPMIVEIPAVGAVEDRGSVGRFVERLLGARV